MSDILIIGNGLAGLSAALTAVEAGASVHLVSFNAAERSQSVMAEGGINAALDQKGEDDSPAQHCADTLRAGCDLADPAAVAALCEAAPEIVTWLERLGTLFNRDAEGRVDQRYFGGQKKMRTAYANAGIGRQLMAALIREARRQEAAGRLQVSSGLHFVQAIVGEQGCCGGIFMPWGEKAPVSILAARTVVATGGLGALFGNNTGSLLSDGAATAALFDQGLELANLEMVQYHPTTVQGPGKRLLISEAARGEGGRLFTYKDGQRWFFMEDWFPEGGNLMPRDVVSRSIFKVTRELGLGVDGRDEVLLDLSFLPTAVLEGKLAEICRTCRTFLHLDPSRQPIPVWPGIHYFMGGLRVGRDHQTSLPGLYAAGECACQYHGANRLGGNSTLGAIYGGRVAASAALSQTSASIASTQTAADIAQAQYQARLTAQAALNGPRPAVMRRLMQSVMREGLAIKRTEDSLNQALEQLKRLQEDSTVLSGAEAADALLLRQQLKLARAALLSARERRESRGAQLRGDWPQRDDEHFLRTTVARMPAGSSEISIDFRPIGEEPCR